MEHVLVTLATVGLLSKGYWLGLWLYDPSPFLHVVTIINLVMFYFQLVMSFFHWYSPSEPNPFDSTLITTFFCFLSVDLIMFPVKLITATVMFEGLLTTVVFGMIETILFVVPVVILLKPD